MSNYKSKLLSSDGYFGQFGGRYVPEMLVPIMDELRDAFFKYYQDDDFLAELQDLQQNYSGRPTPLYFCENLTRQLGGAKIYLKNEGLNHTGAHKINHCLGQILLAKRLGKKRIIAETGAGQHGLATATVCAKMGLECVIYMGKKDYDRQRPNVFWMEQLGAKVVPVYDGGQILRDAITAALKDLLCHSANTHYLLGTICGPHPYPVMNTYFQAIVGKEVRKQLLEEELLDTSSFRKVQGRTEKRSKLYCDNTASSIGSSDEEISKNSSIYLVACVGGGSNAIGLFYEFLDDENVKMIGVEAGGKGIKGNDKKCDHAARMQSGSVGIVEGFKSYFLQNKEGQIKETHSISAGLDYSGVGPGLAYLKDEGRIKFTYATDDEVMKAYQMLARTEGILAAMESSHAMAEVIKLAPRLSKDKIIVFNCSGRGDKDLFIVAPRLDGQKFSSFLKKQSLSF